jgi:HD-GYP domain-containing protein (c-di-GMP phosphodiesterase class II)
MSGSEAAGQAIWAAAQAAAACSPGHPPQHDELHWVRQHGARVASGALELASMLGAPHEVCERVAVAAQVHDIGKLALSATLINKPGLYDAGERHAVETHSGLGHARLLELASTLGLDLALEAEVALLHHERWDGSGYPRGLRGRQIPFAARVIAVVDVYDALVSERPYKRAWAPSDAARYLCEHSGTLFDPECVNAFMVVLAAEPDLWT